MRRVGLSLLIIAIGFAIWGLWPSDGSMDPGERSPSGRVAPIESGSDETPANASPVAAAENAGANPAVSREVAANRLTLRVTQGGVGVPSARVLALPWTSEMIARARRLDGVAQPEVRRLMREWATDANGSVSVERGQDAIALVVAAPNLAAQVRVVEASTPSLEIELSEGASVRVVVRTADRAPLASALVDVWTDERNTRLEEQKRSLAEFVLLPLIHIEGRTDATGLATLHGVHPGLHFVRARFEGLAENINYSTPIPTPNDAEVRLMLYPAASVTGGVFDAETQLPIAGARVEVREYLNGEEINDAGILFTDESGRFECRGAWAFSGDARVQAACDGYATDLIALGTLATSEHREIAFHLKRAATFHGRLVGPGVDLSAMTVVAYDTDPWTKIAYARPNGAGEFVLHEFAQDQAFTFTAGGPDAEWKFFEVPSPWVLPHVVELEVLGVVTGRLIADTYPLRNARVRIGRESRQLDLSIERWAKVDPSTGEFVVVGIPEGTFVLDALAEDHAYQRLPSVAIGALGRRTPIDVHLEPGVEISGRVLDDATSQPISGVQVSVGDRHLFGQTRGKFETKVESATDGSFRFGEAAREKTIDLIFEHADYATAQEEFVVGSSAPSPREIRLERGSKLRATAIRPDGQPANACAWILSTPDRRTMDLGKQLGAVEFGRVAPGKHGLQAVLHDAVPEFAYASKFVDVLVDEKSVTEVTVDFSKGATIRGRVLGELLNQSAADFMVMAVRDGPDETWDSCCSLRPEGAAYSLFGVEPGRRRVKVLALEHEPVIMAQQSIDVREGESYVLDFRIGALTLRGRIIDRDGNPVPGANVWLRTTGKETTQETWSRASGLGEFSVSGLESGEVQLLVSAKGFARSDEVLSLDEESTKSAHEVVLEPSNTIRFHVRDDAHGRILDAKARVDSLSRPNSDPFLPSEHDSADAILVRGMSSGRYAYVVEHASLFPSAGVVDLVGGQDLEVDVVLRSRVDACMKLRDARGAPLKRVGFSLVDLATGEGVEQWLEKRWVPKCSLETDDDGLCILRGVPKGKYRIRAMGIDREIELTKNWTTDDEPLGIMATN